jgi:type VI secretion system secreted protein Hcp
MAIYMKFGNVDGAVATKGYEKWIELQSMQWAVSRAVSSGAGGNTRESSSPNVSEIVVTKELDVASTGLYKDAVGGTFDTKVEIKLTTTTKNHVETYLQITIYDTMISGYSMSSSGDRPTESLSLNFLKVMYTPTPLDKSGQIKKGDIVSYDLLQMKAS